MTIPGATFTLKQLREERGMTQAELAAETGLGIGTVTLLERNGAKPRASTLLKLETVLGPRVAAVDWTVIPENRHIQYRRTEREALDRAREAVRLLESSIRATLTEDTARILHTRASSLLTDVVKLGNNLESYARDCERAAEMNTPVAV
jgi:transcriptional regulator with XRE-family HTH domain